MLRKLTSPNVLAALWRFYRRTEQAELDLIAAGVAFFAFLAIFPAAAAIITIWGLAFDPQVIRSQMVLLRDLLPQEAAQLLERQVEALLAASGGVLGWATLLSTALALWSARAGVAAMIRGLNAIHHLPNRAGHRHQVSALVLTLVLISLALAAMLTSVVLPVSVRSPLRWRAQDSLPAHGSANASTSSSAASWTTRMEAKTTSGTVTERLLLRPSSARSLNGSQ